MGRKVPALFILLVLAGCSQNYMVFTGEGEYWRVEVKATQTGSREDQQIVLKYKKSDIDSVSTLNYKITSPDGEIAGTGQRLTKGGVLETYGGASIDGALLQKDDQLKGVIEWNDKSETVVLTAK
jgi:hypothetical protein